MIWNRAKTVDPCVEKTDDEEAEDGIPFEGIVLSGGTSQGIITRLEAAQVSCLLLRDQAFPSQRSGRGWAPASCDRSLTTGDPSPAIILGIYAARADSYKSTLPPALALGAE